MNWFRRSSKQKPAERAGITHRVTQDFARAENLAMMLAESRGANLLEVADLLAGMYIYDWERLGKYWEDPEQAEDFLRQICRISPQRWHHWIENYDRKRHEEEPTRVRRIFRRTTASDASANADKKLAASTELQRVLKSAGEIAPHHDQADGRTIPVLTCECVLLCMAKMPESELAHRLVASGLNLGNLEREARFPRHLRRK